MAPASRSSRATAGPSQLSVDGGALAYESAGRGAPILFLHSAIADRRMWDREFARFQDAHQVIRFDLRGFGGSTPATAPFLYGDDILALLRHLDVGPVLLVGSSMGGAFAIDFALDHPELVRGLLLVAPGLSGGFSPPFDEQEMAAFEYDEKKSRGVAEAWAAKDLPRAFELLRQLWCVALEGPNRELFRRMVEENATEVFEDPSMKIAKDPPPAAPRLSTLRRPTTVLIGDRDNPSSVPFARRIVRGIPSARLVEVPGADHLINLSRPEAFESALRSALASRA